MKEAPLIGSGMFPKGREETYAMPADNAYLAGTAEVALVGLHSGEILDAKRLPLRYAGISPCFRREIGSASRDVRGLLRVHQFEKVEQFVICLADPAESRAGTPAALHRRADTAGPRPSLRGGGVRNRGHGPGQVPDERHQHVVPLADRCRETHSCSTLHDWQARRASLRYRDTDGTVRFAHTLNNTAVATPRLLAAIIENFQTADHQVRVPEVLRPYIGGRDVL